MKPETLEQLGRDTLCQYTWWDITSDPTGDPDRAQLTRRKSLGFFWELKESGSIPVAVFALMIDEDSRHQSGWDIVPVACIEEVEVLKKPRKRAPKKAASQPEEAQCSPSS